MRLPARLILAATTSVAVLAAVLAAPTQAAPDLASAPAAAEAPAQSAPAAEQALSEAQALLTGDATSAAEQVKAEGRDATLVLRDLRLQLDDLDRADLAAAERLLARPGGPAVKCFVKVCVHYYTTGADKATADYVDDAGEIADGVIDTYVAAGYRAPLPDGSLGGNSKLDIYLENLGDDGLYGYCTSDAPLVSGDYTIFAYCAFDNDYTEFPTNTPLENLQVTAAHEIFHATQYAYDYAEDGWFLEATATWAEDEVYDGVDDNVQYLADSPLERPGKSMDRFGGMWHYGDWIFFRYLTEKYPAEQGGMPILVRRQWELADAETGAGDEYSIQAIAHTLRSSGTSLRQMFADFSAANRRPGATYAEGAANRYGRFVPKPSRSSVLTKNKPGTGWLTSTVDHLASNTVRYTPATSIGATWRLRLTFDLPRPAAGAGAVVTAYSRSGAVTVSRIALNSTGGATKTVAFGTGSKVEVTLANAGIRYSCWQGTSYSCQGAPRDNNLAFKVAAKAIR